MLKLSPQCVLGPLVPEGGALMDEICAVIKETPRIALLPLLPCEDTAGRQLSMNQEEAFHQTPNLHAP